MATLAIDPGNKQSAYVVLGDDGRNIIFKGKIDNDQLLSGNWRYNRCVIEMVACYGMPVGAEVFETVYWIGRFAERYLQSSGNEADRIFRKDIKMYLCGNTRAKDGNIRQALIDMYGGKSAIGLKKSPGALYGVSKDIWAALAVGITYMDTKEVVAV